MGLADLFVYHEYIPMPDAFLAELEVLVMAAVYRLDGDAYGVSIAREIANRARRDVSLGSVYATLSRLAEKGFVTFTESAPLPMRGGRSRRYARVTPAGLRALRVSTSAIERMIANLSLQGR